MRKLEEKFYDWIDNQNCIVTFVIGAVMVAVLIYLEVSHTIFNINMIKDVVEAIKTLFNSIL